MDVGVLQALYCAEVTVHTNVRSSLDNVSRKDQIRGEFQSWENTVGHIPDFVVRIHTLHNGSLRLLRVVRDTKEETPSLTFYVTKINLNLLYKSLLGLVT